MTRDALSRCVRKRRSSARLYRMTISLATVVGILTAGCGDLDSTALGPAEEMEVGVALLPTSISFSRVTLDLAPGYTGALPMAINSAGTVVGWASDASGQPQAVVWEDGVMTPLPGLGGSTSGAEAINSRGDIVGHAETASGEVHAVLWQNGEPLDLGTLGGAMSFARDINDRGDVVGASETAAGRFAAFLWSKGELTDLGRPPGAPVAWATAINNRGDVAGWADLPSQRTTLWRRGTITVLPTLAFEAAPSAINAKGQIVGASIPMFQNNARAVMWEGTEIIDLGGAVGTFSSAHDINQRGQVVGTAGLPGCAQCPVTWSGGAMIPLPVGDPPGGSASAINSRGVIVGWSSGSTPTLWTQAPGAGSKLPSVAASPGRGSETSIRGATRATATPEWADRFCRIQGKIRDTSSALAVAAGC